MATGMIAPRERGECGVRRGKAVCVLEPGHDGQHQAVVQWKPKNMRMTPQQLAQSILATGLHLHRNRSGRWSLITENSKRKAPCTPDICLKMTPGKNGRTT